MDKLIKILIGVFILYILHLSKVEPIRILLIAALIGYLIFCGDKTLEGFEIAIPNLYANAVIKGYEDCIGGKCFDSKNVINNKKVINDDAMKVLNKLYVLVENDEFRKKVNEKIDKLTESNETLDIKMDLVPKEYTSTPKDNRAIYQYATKQLEDIATLIKMAKRYNYSVELEDMQVINETKMNNLDNYFITNPDKLLPKSYDNNFDAFEQIGRNLKDIKESSIEPERIDTLLSEIVKAIRKIPDYNLTLRTPSDVIQPDIVNPDVVNPDVAQIYFNELERDNNNNLA
jgi:hypothetical protein